MTDRVDWDALAGLAMTRLGWSPETFWCATPVDLMTAIHALHGSTPIPPFSKSELTSLRTRFPDADIDATSEG